MNDYMVERVCLSDIILSRFYSTGILYKPVPATIRLSIDLNDVNR